MKLVCNFASGKFHDLAEPEAERMYDSLFILGDNITIGDWNGHYPILAS